MSLSLTTYGTKSKWRSQTLTFTNSVNYWVSKKKKRGLTMLKCSVLFSISQRLRGSQLLMLLPTSLTFNCEWAEPIKYRFKVTKPSSHQSADPPTHLKGGKFKLQQLPPHAKSLKKQSPAAQDIRFDSQGKSPLGNIWAGLEAVVNWCLYAA